VAGVGGYQQPVNPAPASGPGRLSRRTDGGSAQKLQALPDAQYGQQQAFQAQQRGAPVPQADPVRPAGPELVPFDVPSQRPEEPVTAGAASGPGPGPEALAPATDPAGSYGTLAGLLRGLAASDLTGGMAALSEQALNLGLGT